MWQPFFPMNFKGLSHKKKIWNYSTIALLYPRSPKGEVVYCFTSVHLSVLPSVHPSFQDIFRRIFLSNCWWQRSDIWSQASYRYPISWDAFWTHQIPTSCLPTLLIFLHIEHICSFFVAFFSATIDGKNLIFGHKLHIGTPYRGKRFWTHQIATFCLLTLLIFIHIEHVYAHFSSHFSQQLLMAEIWLFVTSFI